MSIHYKNAPIADAVIDVQVSFDAPPRPDELLDFCQKQVAFPHCHEMHNVEVHVSSQLGDGGVKTDVKTDGVLGYRLTNADQTRVLQVRSNGISYEHLPKYTSWELYRAEFEPLLHDYLGTFNPKEATRLAVRYINQIPTPLNIDVATYVNVAPRTIPGAMLVTNYFLQLVLAQPEWPSTWGVILNTGIAGSHMPNTMFVTLDLDVFCGESTRADSAFIWRIMETLRAKKNALFEASITDATRELIK